MISALCVAAGGAIGATLRYLLGLLPWNGTFPLITFLVNLVGCIVIGVIASVSIARVDQISTNLVLFLRVGLCGGFTTFSTFGIETITLFQKGEYVIGSAYAIGTFAICFIGCLIGMWIGKAVAGQA